MPKELWEISHDEAVKAAIKKAGSRLNELTPEQVASKFSEVLREWLEPEEMIQVIERNRTRSHSYICHSHDFCDANMAMSEAFEKLLGLTDGEVCDLATTDDSKINELWNAAWPIAVANEFKF